MTKRISTCTRWGNVYLDAIEHFITSPRAVVRLINSLTIAYPAIGSEVNPVDLIAIETLRIFQPGVYSVLQSNKAMFTGHSWNEPSVSADKLKDFHNGWLKNVEDDHKQAVQRMMIRLFPKMEIVWGNDHHVGASWETMWRKQRRVCSPDVFANFFALSPQAEGISVAEIKRALSTASNSEAFGDLLESYAKQILPNGTSRIPILLATLEDYTADGIPIADIPGIVRAFFKVGDNLLRREDRSGFLGISNELYVSRVIYQLLCRIPDQEERFRILQGAIDQSEATWVMVT